MTDNNSDDSLNPSKDPIIKPKFYIDESNRVICESHTQIERILTLTSLPDNPTIEEILQSEQIITCKTCAHYRNDECYFSKEDIDKIEEDRLSYLYDCKLCGQSIDRPFTIMYSLYNKNKFKVDIPTVCCSCYSTLEKDTYLEESRVKMIPFILKILLFSILLFLSVFFLRTIVMSFGNIYIGILSYGVFFLTLSYGIYTNVKPIIFLIRGRKFYKNTFGKLKKGDKDKLVGDFPFD